VSAEANGGRWRWAGNGVDTGWRVDFSLDESWPSIFESRPDLRSKKYTPLNPMRDPLGQILPHITIFYFSSSFEGIS
jgi:hypothetical protein